MILSFKKQFPPLIEQGIKIHTIREDPKGRWKPGRKIHMATGVRTKKYNCFKESVCVSVQPILIEYINDDDTLGINVIIDGDLFYSIYGGIVIQSKNMIELAKNDGFDSVEDFFKWFSSDFQGKIIHWTDFRY